MSPGLLADQTFRNQLCQECCTTVHKAHCKRALLKRAGGLLEQASGLGTAQEKQMPSVLSDQLAS